MLNSLVHSAVDSFQTGKKFAVTQTVKYEPLADLLNSFVDAQTAYTKSFIDTTTKAAVAFGDILMSKDFATDVLKVYTPTTVVKAASRKAK